MRKLPGGETAASGLFRVRVLPRPESYRTYNESEKDPVKKHSDPRHKARRLALQSLFEWIFYSRDPITILKENITRAEEEATAEGTPLTIEKHLAQSLIDGVVNNREEIDRIITQAAPEWPIEQIAKIDLAILRLSLFELLFAKTVPPKVVIDEAVELGKEFGSEASSNFINGVLGTVLRNSK